MSGKKIMITLSERKLEELEQLSQKKGVSKSVFVAIAIEEFIKRGESNESK